MDEPAYPHHGTVQSGHCRLPWTYPDLSCLRTKACLTQSCSMEKLAVKPIFCSAGRGGYPNATALGSGVQTLQTPLSLQDPLWVWMKQ